MNTISNITYGDKACIKVVLHKKVYLFDSSKTHTTGDIMLLKLRKGIMATFAIKHGRMIKSIEITYMNASEKALVKVDKLDEIVELFESYSVKWYTLDPDSTETVDIEREIIRKRIQWHLEEAARLTCKL